MELSAETRAVVGDVLRAHDDPAVSVAEFAALLEAVRPHLLRLPEPEAIEARLRIGEHTMSHLVGRRMTAYRIERVE